jgi:uridine kinase
VSLVINVFFCAKNSHYLPKHDLMSRKINKSYVVGISGGSGSGKTSFIRDIKKEFGTDQITVLSQDDYYRPRHDQRIDKNGIHNFDLPESILLHEFERDLKLLIDGNRITREEYTFNNDAAASKKLIFEPAPIILVEGLFVFYNPQLYDLMDLRIMIHATDIHKIIRRIKRDQVERNYPLEDVLYRYQYHVLPSYEQFINPFLNKVDIVINNNENYSKGRDMLVAYLKNKIG